MSGTITVSASPKLTAYFFLKRLCPCVRVALEHRPKLAVRHVAGSLQARHYLARVVRIVVYYLHAVLAPHVLKSSARKPVFLQRIAAASFGSIPKISLQTVIAASALPTLYLPTTDSFMCASPWGLTTSNSGQPFSSYLMFCAT